VCEETVPLGARVLLASGAPDSRSYPGGGGGLPPFLTRSCALLPLVLPVRSDLASERISAINLRHLVLLLVALSRLARRLPEEDRRRERERERESPNSTRLRASVF